jgi:hypothetical protein
MGEYDVRADELDRRVLHSTLISRGSDRFTSNALSCTQPTRDTGRLGSRPLHTFPNASVHFSSVSLDVMEACIY